MLILLGSAGFYSQYSSKLGRLGSVGFLLAFIGGANRPGELLVVGTVIGPLIAAQGTITPRRRGSLYSPLLLTVDLSQSSTALASSSLPLPRFVQLSFRLRRLFRACPSGWSSSPSR